MYHFVRNFLVPLQALMMKILIKQKHEMFLKYYLINFVIIICDKNFQYLIIFQYP